MAKRLEIYKCLQCGNIVEVLEGGDGTSYNAYIIKGSEKTALLDTVSPASVSQLKDNIKKTGIEKIDYLISHHAEQDHSAAIPFILHDYPEAKIVTNQKCKDFLIDLLCLPENQFIVVEDGQQISLGDKTLEFIYTPWVHWPETLCTYLKEDKILFSCDFFGSHQAASDLFVKDPLDVYEPAKRYFAEIMMPFRAMINKNLERLSKYEIDIIAPSHGPLYPDPSYIIEKYTDWCSDNVKNEVVIAYVSMHGSTKKMVEHFVTALIEKNITVKQFDLAVTDLGKLAISLVDAATIVIATSTVLAGAHPLAANAAFIVNALRPKTKFLSIIGSYGWGGKTIDQLKDLLKNSKAQIVEPVLTKGYPKTDDFKLLDELADKIFENHKNLNIT